MKIDRIETEHLILRKAKIDDLDQIWMNIWSDEEVAATMLWHVDKTREEAKDRLLRTMEFQKDNYAFFVTLKDTGEVIGFSNFVEKENGTYEDFGICIARKYQGLGYGKEIVGAFKEVIFDKLNGKTFTYSCFKENERTRKVCLAHGFKYVETKPIVRKWDGQEFDVDYYCLDRNTYLNNK